MFEHLSERARKVMALSDEERIRFIRTPWPLSYPRALEILRALEDLLTYPRSHRMPNLLVYGTTNNGKTMLVNEFCLRHQARDEPDGQHVVVPILYVQAPPSPHEGRFYNELIQALYAPGKFGGTTAQRQAEVRALMKDIGVRMLIIDEIQHIFAGGPAQQRAFLNMIKFLGNDLQIPIVAVGIETAAHAFRHDAQLANRFESMDLPLWEAGKELKQLLVGFERNLPLKQPSYLHHTTLALQILKMSEGTIGEIAAVLQRAAVHAIRTGGEHIDERVLNQVAFVPPSQRKTA
jgi:hypothetical protein